MSLIDYEKLMMGAAHEFGKICWVYQLKISEIIGMGGDTFNRYLSLVSTSTAELQRDFSKRKIPPEDIPNSYFEYLLNLVKYDSNFLLELKKAFFTFIREDAGMSCGWESDLSRTSSRSAEFLISRNFLTECW